MKLKRSILLLLLAVFLLFLNIQPDVVQADNDKSKIKKKYNKYKDHDDDDDEHEHDDDDEHEYYKHDDDDDDHEYDDDDHDEKYYQPVVQQPVTPVIQQSTFIWDRNKLPVEEATTSTFVRQSIEITIENNPSALQVAALNNEGMMIVPLKNSAQFFGSEVYWHPKYQVIEVKLNDKQLLFKVGKAVVYENGKKLPMPTAAILIDGTVYVPVNVLTDGLGFQVNINNATPNKISLTRR